LLRDWAGLLFDTVRGCNAGVWVDWTLVVFVIKRGLKPHPPSSVETPRGLEAAEVDDADILPAVI
jgi:hypothetical protein